MISTQLNKIKSLTAQELLKPQAFQEIEGLVAIYRQDFRFGDAQELWQFLNHFIEDNSGIMGRDLLMKYKIAITKFSWLAMPFLANSEIENLFKNNLLIGIDLEIELIDQIKTFIGIVFGDLRSMGQRRFLILNALKNNEELLGEKQLEIEAEREKFSPAIKNWLKDYDQSTQLKQRLEKISLLEYINTGKNVRQLDQKQKIILRKILELYDFLRFLPPVAEIETTTHRIPTTLKTTFETPFKSGTTIPQTTLVREKEILEAYRGDSKQSEAIIKEERGLNKIKDNVNKLREEFYQAVQARNVNKTIAVLRLMAKAGDLENFLVQDPKLNQFLRAIWEKQYGKALVNNFEKNPSSLKFIRLFLQYVLQQRLGMTESDAARVGLQIGNIFVNRGKKEYNKMAYFDLKTKVFKWF